MQIPIVEVNVTNNLTEETQNLEQESKNKDVFNAEKIDAIGLKMTQRNLATIVMNKLFKPLPETITIKANKLKNLI